MANVIAESPAYEGGVNAGDELVAIDGKKIDANNGVERQGQQNVLNDLSAGQRVTMTVFRRERMMNFNLTAAAKPFDRYTITELKDAGETQKALRDSWLSKEKDAQKQ